MQIKQCLKPSMGLAMAGLLLAGCGTNSQDRVQGGAAVGAATGAGIGLVGGPIGVVVGGLIGGGVGAVTGATVPPRDMNMGAPPWSDKANK